MGINVQPILSVFPHADLVLRENMNTIVETGIKNVDSEPTTSEASKEGPSTEKVADGSHSVTLTRRATGPRTRQGKQRSKHNALKHGIFSKIVLLEGDSRTEFNSLLNGLRNDLRPEGALEEILVEKLAALLWRHRRILIAEGAEIQRGVRFHSSYKSERDEQEAIIFLRSEGNVRVGLFSRIENPFIQERCLDVLRHLKESIELRGFDSSVDTRLLTVLFGDIEMTAQSVSLVMSYALCTHSGKYPDLKELDKLEGEKKELIEKLATPEGRKDKFLQSLQLQIDGLQGLQESPDRITAPREKLEELCRSVPNAPELDRLLRYEATLERYFDRTLSQLERQQRMRMGQPVSPKLEVRHSLS